MAVKRAAVMDGDGNVVNVILLDDSAEYDPGEGLSLVTEGVETVGPGWHQTEDGFEPEPEPEPEPE
jgi:hypothetical protein